MSLMRTVGCKLGWHAWEPVVGDVAGAHHQCLYCGTIKRVDTGHPPDAHDKSGIHT
jgi:hypothetical protein